jgi:hypothetical protein
VGAATAWNQKSRSHIGKIRKPFYKMKVAGQIRPAETQDQSPSGFCDRKFENWRISLFESGRNPLKSPDSEK